MKTIMKIGIMLLLLASVSVAGAATIVKTEIKEYQYGSFLYSYGYGNALYQYTYSDGSIVLKTIRGIQLLPFEIAPIVSRDIRVSGAGSCKYSDDTFDVRITIDGRTVVDDHKLCPAGQAYAISRIPVAVTKYDTIHYNNVMYQSPASIPLSKVTTITTVKLSETSTQETLRTIITFDYGLIDDEIPLMVDDLQIGLMPRLSGSSKEISVILNKDGKNHRICADTVCSSYTSGGSITPTTAPTPVPALTTIPKPQLLPLSISRQIESIWAAFTGLFGLSMDKRKEHKDLGIIGLTVGAICLYGLGMVIP